MRQQAYHRGTLAHEILGTTRYDDQNHAPWIARWMDMDSVSPIDEHTYSIALKAPVYIGLVPLALWAGADVQDLARDEIRKANPEAESRLIQSYLQEGVPLLNVGRQSIGGLSRSLP